MLVTAEPNARDAARRLWQEAKELTLIFAAICRKKRGGEEGNDQGPIANKYPNPKDQWGAYIVGHCVLGILLAIGPWSFLSRGTGQIPPNNPPHTRS